MAEEPAAGYIVHWATFDNTTGQAAALGTPTATKGRQSRSPVSLPSAPGAFVEVQISAATPDHPSWAVPVDAFFRRGASGWTLVGLDRLPRPAEGGQR